MLEVIRLEERDFLHPGIQLDEAPFLKGVHADGDMVQWIAVDKLLPEELIGILFAEERSSSSEAP